MKDESQPPRAECDACGEPATRRSDEGFSLCTHCYTQKPSNVVDDMVAARRRSLQSAQKWSVGDRAWHTYAGDWCTLIERGGSSTAWFASFDREPGRRDVHILEEFLTRSAPDTIPLQPTPPAKHEWQPGMRVTWDERENPCGAKFGVVDPVGSINRLYASIYGDGAYVSLDKPNADNIREWWVPLNILRPAVSAQPESHKFEVGGDYTAIGLSGCQRRGKFIRIDDSGNARLDDNGREWAVQTDTLRLVTTSAKTSESKPSPQPRRDPYAEHRTKPTYSDERRWLDEQNWAHAAMLKKHEQAKADLDRPIRTGALGNRDRYGQLLSLRGWNTDDVDDELGCS